MKKEELMALADQYIMPTYARFSVLFTRGAGIFLEDSSGKKYIDMAAGIGVNALGYNHPKIIKAIEQQAHRLLHISNLYYTEPMILLAKKLVELFGDTERARVFFCNSGAEANEAALKLAKRYKRVIRKQKEAYEIISFKNSFHGRTMATVAVTGQRKYSRDFLPLIKGVKFAEFNNIASVRRLITPRTAAIIVEPVQGEGGVTPATKEFLQGLRALADENDLVLIFDEVQCGIARTGTFFAFEHFGVKPDVVTLAKGLGGGLPIGAIIAQGKFADVLTAGTHASTFGGNPLVCSVANVVVDEVSKPEFLEKVRSNGEYLLQRLAALKSDKIKEVRGLGLMIGVELKRIKVADIVQRLLERGVVALRAGENVLRFLPPLIIERKDIDRVLEILDEVLG